MKIIKKILVAIISILMILIMAFNIYRFVCINILKKDMATINGYVALEVISGSMEPTINIGDIIIVDTKIKKFKKDDIISFYDKDGSFITHRIVSINGKKFITKGDNNNTEDEAIDISKVIGKFVFKIDNGKKFLSLLKNPLIIILVLVNGVLFCIFVSIDRNGNVVLDEEEKEYVEFKKYLNKKNKK